MPSTSGRLVAAALVLVAAVSGCSLTSSDSSPEEAALDLPTDLEPEPGTAIPQHTVAVGFTPYGDGLVGVAAENRGYFEEVGITFSQDNGIQADFSESFTPLLNGQVEIASGYMPFFTQQIDTVTNLRTFMLSNVYLGTRVLAPAGRYQTVDELMEQGQTFEEAAATVMEQLRGRRVVMPDGVDPTFFNLALEQAGMTQGDVDVVRMSNPDIVRTAQAGDTDFAAPDGAVQISQLQQAGWEAVITIEQVIDALPDQTLDVRNVHTGYLTTTEYAEENYNTLLRFASVMYRISAELEADPVAVAADFTDYLNSYTGSSLSVQEVAGMFSNGLYSFRTFDTATDFLGPDSDSPYYFAETSQAQIATLRENDVLLRDHDVDDLSIAATVYEDLRDYREEAERLIAEAPEGELRTQAQTYFDHYNFLDAYRFALAATEEGTG